MIFVPMLHYLQNKNSFSGNEDGMRYLITPGKRSVPAGVPTRPSWTVSPGHRPHRNRMPKHNTEVHHDLPTERIQG